MAPQKTRLICFTKWGSECYSNEFPSKKQALEEARWMVDNNYAFSYKIKSIR